MNTNLRLNQDGYYIELDGNPKEIVSAEITINATVAGNNSIKIYATTNSSTQDHGQSWEAVDNMTEIGEKTSTGSETIQIDNSTFLGWLDDTGPAKRIYFGFKQSSETAGSSEVTSFTIRVYYKYTYPLSIRVDQSLDGFIGSYDIGNGPVNFAHAGVDLPAVAEETDVEISFNQTAQYGTTLYVYANMTDGINTFPDNPHSFPMTSGIILTGHYLPGVLVTLDNQAQFLAGGSTRIDGSQISATNNGTLIRNVTAGNMVPVPQGVSIDYKTLHGNNGEDLSFVYNSTAYKIKHQNWNGDLGFGKLTYSKPTTTPPPTPYTANYHELRPATIKLSLDGILQNNIPLQFKDPWRVVSGAQPGNWYNYNSGTNLGVGNDGSTIVGVMQNVIYNQSFPNNAHYRVKTDDPKTIDNSESWFLNWSNSNATVYSPSTTETAVKFDAPGAVVTANYKGHLRTSVPTSGDSKNQRRVHISGYNWVMVYESMGEIWLSRSEDGGVTWYGDVRLSGGTGAASNPSLSNVLVFEGYDPYSIFLISWIENGKMHLQSMNSGQYGGGPYYGWVYEGESATQNSSNHITVGGIFADKNIGKNPKSTARPVTHVSYDLYSDQVKITYAFEGESTGVITGLLTLSLDQGIFSQDINYASIVMFNSLAYRTITTLSASQQPVIVNPEIVFCLSGSSTSSLVITKYQYSTNTSSNVSIPMYTNYQSLQGALNADNGQYALVAHSVGMSNGGSTDLFTIGPPNWTLQMTTRYTDKVQPTVMVEQDASYGSLTRSIIAKDRTSINWYRIESGNVYSVGANIAGAYTRERIPVSDRAAIVTRSTAVSNPARIEYYDGSTTLQKSGGLYLAKSIRRFWKDRGVVKNHLIDFSKLNFERIDSLEKGSVICAVKVLSTDVNDMIATRKESKDIPIGVSVLRHGRNVRSFSPSTWESITETSIGGIEPNDVVLFSTTGIPEEVHGFEEVTIVDESLKKESGEISCNPLIPLELSATAFPNPFNPSTTFRVSLPQATNVRLAVYNMLGQKVATLIDGAVQAGHNDFRFDGSSLSSGIYLYRMEIAKEGEREIKSGKIMLMK